MKLIISVLSFSFLIFASAVGQSPAVTRHDFQVESAPGISLFVREVTASSAKPAHPILLLHGARVPGLASFDLPVPGGSLAADFAQQEFTVYIMDVRGYGRSTRPLEMNEPPEKNPPLVRSDLALRDIDAVVQWIGKRTGAKPALFGWATGGFWAGYYASLHSDSISGLVMLNSLYGGSDKHSILGHGTDLEDPAHTGRLSPNIKAYRWNTAESLFGVWDKSIPETDKTVARDPKVAQAYRNGALASDPASSSHQPPAFRSPNGCLEDSFYIAIGRRLWDASLVYVPTLVITSQLDFWSRPEDRAALEQDLVHAPRVKVLVIPNATHFVHLERPARGRDVLIHEVVTFLSSNP